MSFSFIRIKTLSFDGIGYILSVVEDTILLGGTGEIRTHGLRIRSLALYPAELQSLEVYIF
jgi:hypothetical protein